MFFVDPSEKIKDFGDYSESKIQNNAENESLGSNKTDISLDFKNTNLSDSFSNSNSFDSTTDHSNSNQRIIYTKVIIYL